MSFRVRFIGLLAIAILSSAGAAEARTAASHDSGWTTFLDPYTGTVVEYPAGIFSKAGASPRGSGREFRTADGRAKLTVYTLANAKGERPEAYLKHHLLIGHETVEYRRITRQFFALSGVHDGEVFYSRCNFSRAHRRTMRCILLQYPEREARKWDGIVTRISLSVRGAPTGGTGTSEHGNMAEPASEH